MTRMCSPTDKGSPKDPMKGPVKEPLKGTLIGRSGPVGLSRSMPPTHSNALSLDLLAFYGVLGFLGSSASDFGFEGSNFGLRLLGGIQSVGSPGVFRVNSYRRGGCGACVLATHCLQWFCMFRRWLCVGEALVRFLRTGAQDLGDSLGPEVVWRSIYCTTKTPVLYVKVPVLIWGGGQSPPKSYVHFCETASSATVQNPQPLDVNPQP